MNRIKLICLASLFASGAALAAPPCDGFEIKLKNNLADDLVVKTIKLNGEEIQPAGIQKLDSKEEQGFLVSQSTDGTPIVGQFVFYSQNKPGKEVKIEFDLKNSGFICEHTDHSPNSDYAVEKTRLPGKVNYTICNG